MPLSQAWFLAMTPDALRALSKLRGDPKRRGAVQARVVAAAEGGSNDVVAVGPAWSFIEHLAGSPTATRLFRGTALHRASSHRIELLDVPTVSARLAALAAEEDGTRAAFLAIDEEAWRYRYLTFGVRDEWSAAGRTTILDDEHAKIVARGLMSLRGLVARVKASGEELLFFQS